MRKTPGLTTLTFALTVLGAACGDPLPGPSLDLGGSEQPLLEEVLDALPNDFPIPNASGVAATHSEEGFVDLDDTFHTPQGTNGRHCATCHAVESGWSITPLQIELLFALTDGTHPIFNALDANNPAAPVVTVEEKRAAYSMLRRGLFRRGGAPPAGAEFVVIAAADPHGLGTVARPSFFRRPLTTANMQLITGNMWDDRLSVPAAGGGNDVRTGLFNQAKGNITGAQQGATPTDATVNAIVDEELAIWHAQSWAGGVRLDSCGAKGGAAHLAEQPLVAGRWDLFDAWIGLRPGSCTTRRADEKRAQIARGQELFNEKRSATGGRCAGCHNAVNNGTNVGGVLFDIKTSDPAFATADMPVYTLHNLATGVERQTTDPGKGFVSGKWGDVNRFKAPTLRGVSSRAPYFHNGIAGSLTDVVRHYEVALGFELTAAEEKDLVAFLEAL